MTNQQQRTRRYPSLLVSVKCETDERSVTEIYSNSRTRRSKDNYRPTYIHPKTVYYNSNHRRQQQHFIRPTPPPAPTIQHHRNTYDKLHYPTQYQPIRPLMEIKHTHFSDDHEIPYRSINQREPKQRGQYRNRKAELDWDHGFDLDQIDLYTTQNDIDNYSLTSTNSSSDNSFSYN